MRALSVSLLALVLAGPSFAHEPRRQLIVATPAHAPAFAGPRLAERLESFGLRVVGSLADGIPNLEARSRAGSFARPDATPWTNPFDLDPARVWLLEAPDSICAAVAAAALADDPEVEWVERNQPREPTVATLETGASRTARSAPAQDFPDDPLFRDSRQWGLRNLGPAGAYGGVAGADIHALEAWTRSTGANDLRLAVADTGIDPGHPELNARLPGGGSRIELGINVTIDPSPAFADSYGHGTAVTGVMAALTAEGSHFDSLGIAGVCGGDGRGNVGCRIVPIKIAPGTTAPATSFDIARAMVYAANVGARAMNLSYAGRGPSRVERNALYYAITRGCVVVAAAGNQGQREGDAPQYPAAYAADGLCIQVGASDPHDRRAVFSSHGPGLDLVAPGVQIWTTSITYPNRLGGFHSGYLVGSGTSYATPFATGAVGLLAAAHPELVDSDFQRLLRESADDIGTPGVDLETGWGRLNVARALRSVEPSFGIWHDEVAGDRLSTLSMDTLAVLESGPGMMQRARLWPDAELVQVSATVSLPDSFLDSVRVWPRVGGTMTVRGNFELPYFAPWAEVAWLDDRSFSLRGHLFRLPEEDGYLPLPPDQARFGFTVIGRVDRPPALRVFAPSGPIDALAGDSLDLHWKASDPDQVTAVEIWLESGRGALQLARVSGDERRARVHIPCPPPFVGPGEVRIVALDEHGRHRDRTSVTIPVALGAGACRAAFADPAALAATPNPFRRELRISGAPGSAVSIIDLSGRVVRRGLLSSASGEFLWDGCDAAGRRLKPGLYMVVSGKGGRRAQAKVLKLE